MNELIKIQEKEGKQLVSARDLHTFLEVKTDVILWCKRMFEYGFEEGQDYTALKTENPVNQQVTIQDFALTLDCAKEISMIQRSEKGKEARQYFIKCEKQLQQIALHSYQIEDPIKRAEKWIEEQKQKQLLEQNNEVLQIELDEHKAWYSVKRVCLLGYFKNKDAKTLWQPLKAYSIANNYQIKGIFDANYGEVKTYHKEVWKAVYNINL
jgi:anti-repressor protein